MPQIFKVGSYVIFFWANENLPLEPVHVHISYRIPSEVSSKVWITKSRKGLLCHNDAHIPRRLLTIILEIISSRSSEIIEKWLGFFGQIDYYC
ncbi:MAG: DUF4160 domain-containing protein [Lachnospiraceae bacterium]|jgi:hypothetical protein|nr:DUF4160 domain-containing protein [Lachnospiraceae bacterium]